MDRKATVGPGHPGRIAVVERQSKQSPKNTEDGEATPQESSLDSAGRESKQKNCKESEKYVEVEESVAKKSQRSTKEPGPSRLKDGEWGESAVDGREKLGEKVYRGRFQGKQPL